MVFEIKLILGSCSCLCRIKYFNERRKLLLSSVFVRSLHQFKSGMSLCKSAMRDRKNRNLSTQHINRIAAKGSSGGRGA